VKRFVLATRNTDKVSEIQKIMNLSISLVGIGSFPEAGVVIEDGQTLHENALKKARAAFTVTGLPSIADDTGLEVDVLNGQPGVLSSRFAGEHVTYADNNRKLLRMLQGVPEQKRTARFRCVTCLVDGNHIHYEEGISEGIIILELRGKGGFGYDPLFFVPELNKTFAELSVQEKNAYSHRGKAFRAMAAYMQKRYGLERRNKRQETRNKNQEEDDR
jgi:XTP/dITP diphosphohydrolase